jgi:hypothetical protein
VSELERDLSRLGAELRFPDSPPLATAVTERLAAEPGPGRPRALLLPRALAIALAALLVVAGGVVAAVPGARDAVLDILGLRGATVERREALPPLPAAAGLDLGRRVPLAEARRSVDFRLLVPAGLGRPDAAYLRSGVPGGEAALIYRARPGLPRARPTGLGLLVSEFRGDLHPDYVGKIAGQATAIERLRVGPHRAIWVAGAPHLFFYRAPGGGFREDSLRLAGNVLLVERGRVLVRLEGALSRARAVATARSLR